MDCCDPAVTRSWRLFRKRFVHIQENCSDFSPRLYIPDYTMYELNKNNFLSTLTQQGHKKFSTPSPHP